MAKREAVGGGPALALQKRARVDSGSEDELEGQQLTVSRSARNGLVQYVKRTSALQAPIMTLSGHAGEVLDVRFDATGHHLASISMDHTLCLWNTYGDCENYGVLRPPQAKAIFSAVCWPSQPTSRRIYACTSDGLAVIYSTTTGQPVRRHRGAVGALNALDCVRGTGRELLLCAGDDGVARIWDADAKEIVETVAVGHAVTAARWSADGQQAFLGGLDNDVHCYDLRKRAVLYSLRAHQGTVAGMSLSPNGHALCTAAFDDTVCIWDVRSFVADTNGRDPSAPPRLRARLAGAPAGFDSVLRKPAWDPTGARVAVGSADRTVCVWNAETGQLTHKLPGHNGTVISVDFSPDPAAPILASGGADRQIFVGELDAHAA